MGQVSADKLKKFQQFKKSTLEREDLSLKGSIDEKIIPLVNIINNNPRYCTTSTCSGRVTLIEKPYECAGLKKGSHFLLNSHDQVDIKDAKKIIASTIQETSQNCDGDRDQRCLWLKFEPFIVHIQCLDLNSAHKLLNLAIANGCRNSGITLSRGEKFMVAMRSTSGMEIPISCGDRFDSLNQNYLHFLFEECNRRMADNFNRLKRLENSLSTGLSEPDKNFTD